MNKHITTALCLTAFSLLCTPVPAANKAKTAVPAGMTKAEAETAKDSIAQAWKKEMRAKYIDNWNTSLVKVGGKTMRYWENRYGKAPEGGFPLYISLHGGGSGPAEMNNQQWDNQKHLYVPANAWYIAPRAPYDDWDMWCKPDLDQYYETLITMAQACANVNPDRIYIMGYSAGGDGVWRMAPRMADRWAAASMMAGHPGDVQLENLRNTPYMIWCGALDAAYDRNKEDARRGEVMDSLQQADPEGYIHETHIVEGKAHWMDRVDTVAVSWMAQYKRNPYPTKIVWRQEEVVRPSFYWLTAPANELERGKTVRLEVKGNVIDINECDYSTLTLWLNDQLVDLDQKVKIICKGKTLYNGFVARSADNLKTSLYDRGDLSFSFPAKVEVKIKK